jgi:hypothetical protein
LNQKTLNRSLEIAHGLFDPNLALNFHVSLAFYKGRVVGIATNDSKTSPVNLYNRKYNREGLDISTSKGRCSELNLYIKLKNKTNLPFEKLDIVNVRINRNKELALSKPCLGCSSLIQYLKPKSLFYSLDGGQFIKYE